MRITTLKLLKPGEYRTTSGPLNPTVADLAAIADMYDPQLHRAPIVLGHPGTDEPAHGWIDRLEVKAGFLVGHPVDLSEEVQALVEKGRYRRLSISLYGPDSANNPTPRNYYLKHVGLLGAAAPVVKGLGDVKLSEEIILSIGGAPDTEDLSEELNEWKRKYSEREGEIRSKENRKLCVSLADEGRILPRHIEPLSALFDRFAGEEITLSDDSTVSPVELVSDVVSSEMPIYEELGAEDKDLPPTQPISVPEGWRIDSRSDSIYRAAKRISQSQEISLSEAILRAERGV